MAGRTYNIPGHDVFVTETTDQREFIIPGTGVFINETSTAGAGEIVEADLASAGAGALSLASLALFVGVLSSVGAATPTLVSGKTARVDISSAGVGAFGVNSGALSSTILASAGVGVFSPVVETPPSETTLTISGVATPTLTGAGRFDSVVTTAGTGAFNVFGGNGVDTSFTISGVGALNGVGGLAIQGALSSAGVGALSFVSDVSATATSLDIQGVSLFVGTSGKLAQATLNIQSTGLFGAVAPQQLTPLSYEPIERRDVRLPKLPTNVTPEKWIDIATREFDRFFHDLHYYFAGASFVSGVHTEVVAEGFTLTPETSVIFVMSDGAVASDPVTAIKSISDVPRVFIVVNVGLFPVTIKDEANTVFGGTDVVLPPGKITLFVYTGASWVGNAI